MRHPCRLVLVVLVLSLFGCATIKVGQDYDPSFDFTRTRSYAWLSPVQPQSNDPRADNPLLDGRIRAAIDAGLAAKGFQIAVSDLPDLHVRYLYSVDRRLETDDFNTGFGFGFGSSGPHTGIGFGTGYGIREVDEGLLVIDLLDAATGKLLWRGTGVNRLHDQPDPARAAQAANETVARILSQFQPVK